jgi:polyhydroxyalkanoate synthesis regulator phasin
MKQKIKNYIWEKLEEDIVVETKKNKVTKEGFVKGGFVTEKEVREVFQEILQTLEKGKGIEWMNSTDIKDEESRNIINDISQKVAQEYFNKKAKAEFPYFFPKN